MTNLDRIRFVVFDVDGVLTRVMDNDGQFLWKKTLEADLGIPLSVMRQYFQTHWGQVVVGKLDAKEALARHFREHKIQVTPDEFVSYWHSHDAQIVESMVDAARRVREAGYEIYLGTNQEQYRMSYLWHDLELGQVFHGKFPSGELGVQKPNPEYYARVQSALGCEGDEILFIDDTESIVQGAHQAGWQAYWHQEVSSTLEAVIAPLLSLRKRGTRGGH